MAEEFLKLSRERQRATLEGAEATLGIKPYFLEKDIWICWVLKELFALSKKMAFKSSAKNQNQGIHHHVKTNYHPSN